MGASIPAGLRPQAKTGALAGAVAKEVIRIGDERIDLERDEDTEAVGADGRLIEPGIGLRRREQLESVARGAEIKAGQLALEGRGTGIGHAAHVLQRMIAAAGLVSPLGDGTVCHAGRQGGIQPLNLCGLSRDKKDKPHKKTDAAADNAWRDQ